MSASETGPGPDPSDPNVTNEEIGRWLREQPISARAEWVLEHIGDPLGAFDVAKRAGFRAHQARELVEKTVHRADASTIRWWVEFYSNVAGLRRTLQMLDEWEDEGHRERVGMAGYWLSSVSQAQTEEGRAILAQARRKRKSGRSPA